MVEPPTEEELEDGVKTIGVKDNAQLTEQEQLLLKHMVSYTWATFDEKMRPVDGPAVKLKFRKHDQQPIKLPPYRLTPEKIMCLKEQIAEWERDGIVRRGSSPSPWACILF